jgi:DNA-binding CsgD family transcriptional regulator
VLRRRLNSVGVMPPERRESLRRAALVAQREPLEREPRAGVWAQLVEGLWTIVDSFDAEGRWVIIARRNDLSTASRHRLSPVEREVVARAALGMSNKLIGHDLALAASTVANHLTAAEAKLGARGRIELIKTYHALNRRPR